MRWPRGLALREVMLIFWPDQRVEQRGLAHVGLAHDRDQAAALRAGAGTVTPGLWARAGISPSVFI
jgi:hypothetical protein